MSWKTLKSNNIEVSKREFHVPKQPIASDSMLRNKIVVSDRYQAWQVSEHSVKDFKYFTDYK